MRGKYMPKNPVTIGTIPGFRIEMPKDFLYDFLKRLESEFPKEIGTQALIYKCVKGGHTKNPIYHIESENRDLLRKVGMLITSFAKSKEKVFTM
ncbi:MAG TPA: hypothetical protein VHQ20_01305 [Patescibacteria group bacterium]|jgi:hypothetical protein|nr:hypothetical protein [Patescibacteria group bacterium]